MTFRFARLLASVVLLGATLATAVVPTHAAPVRSGTTITVWTFLSTNETKLVQTLANQWGSMTGNTVKVLTNPTSGFQGFASVAHTGKGPDVIFAIPHDNLGTFMLAGLVKPVPAGIFDAGSFVPGAIQAVTFAGKYDGVPLNMGTYELVYNKALVPHPPTTWDQLFKLAKSFPNSKGKTYGFFEDWTNAYFSYSLIRGFGGYYLKNTPTGVNASDIGLATPASIKALKFIQSMYTSGIIPPDVTGNIAGSLFQKGQLAMWIDGTWDITANGVALGKNFGATALPMLPGGLQPHAFSSVYVASVSAFTHNEASSWNLIKYLAARYPTADISAGGNIPVQKSLLSGPAITRNAILSGYARAVLLAEPMPNVPQMQAVWGPVSNQISLMIHGKVTAEQAGANMVSQIKQGEAQYSQ